MQKIHAIGTVVRVGVSEELLMIISRYPMTIKNGVEGYFDYEACEYPIGVVVNENPRMFNHDEITEVLFEGFVNQMEKNLTKFYQENLKDIPYPKHTNKK